VKIPEPDEQLISAAKKGNRNAMAILLQPWNNPIFGFHLRNLRNRTDAENASHETFIRIVKGLKKYEHRGQFRAWIFQIARNQAALTANRVSDREAPVDSDFLESFAAEMEDDPDYETLRAAIGQLPEAERKVVLLRMDDDLLFREIARHIGAPLNTVLGRMRDATQRLREILT